MNGKVSLVRMLAMSFWRERDEKERVIVLSDDRELSLPREYPATTEELETRGLSPMKKNNKSADEIKTNNEKRSSMGFNFFNLLYYGRGSLAIEILGELFLLMLILVAYFTGNFFR
ncbi:hypothetical protein SDD30_14155 [Moorella naiadis]|uniref:hypothetical protein n=1 Tax=Moorella naiadis (nom. illeg.) TaxID=3093670 RepID=UPI003D9C9451